MSFAQLSIGYQLFLINLEAFFSSLDSNHLTIIHARLSLGFSLSYSSLDKKP